MSTHAHGDTDFQQWACFREKDCISDLQSKIFRSVLPLSSVCCAPSTPEESLRGPWLRVCLQERMEMIGPYNTLSHKLLVVWNLANFTFSCLRVAERSLSRGRRGFSGHLSVPRWHSALLPESGPFGCGE